MPAKVNVIALAPWMEQLRK